MSKELYEMNCAGMTYDQIAAKLGKTKGQVAGAIHRYKKANGVVTVKKKKEPEEVQGKSEEVKKAPRKVKDNANPLGKQLADLKHRDCRYPYGNGPFTFCGQPCRDGSDYCPEHHTLCHTGKTARDHKPTRRGFTFNKMDGRGTQAGLKARGIG